MKNKRMKFCQLVLCAIVLMSSVADTYEKFSDDEIVISRIVDALSELSLSLQCTSDLNATISAYRERKAWAIASKHK